MSNHMSSNDGCVSQWSKRWPESYAESCHAHTDGEYAMWTVRPTPRHNARRPLDLPLVIPSEVHIRITLTSDGALLPSYPRTSFHCYDAGTRTLGRNVCFIAYIARRTLMSTHDPRTLNRPDVPDSSFVSPMDIAASCNRGTGGRRAVGQRSITTGSSLPARPARARQQRPRRWHPAL